MKRFIAGVLFVGLIVLGPGVRGQQSIVWVSQFGTTAGDFATQCGADAAGNAYVSGGTEGTLPEQFSAGATDAFLRKYAPDGTVRWTRQFGTSDGDGALVSVHETGVYVLIVTRTGAGSLTSDSVELRKYDFDGNELLRKTLVTGGGFGAHGFFVHATGVYWVGGGHFPGRSTEGLADAFIKKLDFDGNELWARFFSTPTSRSFDEYQSVSADATQIYVFYRHEGAALHAYGFDGTLFWQSQFAPVHDGGAVHAAASGIYVVGGAVFGPDEGSLGGMDAFLIKFDSAGNQWWKRVFGTSGHDVARAVSADPTGVYVGGLGDTSYPFLAKFDHDGGALGQSVLDASGEGYGVQGLCASPFGVYAVGRVSGSLLGQPAIGGLDAFALKLAPSVITVLIDIKPGSFPNSINPRSQGKIPVAILSASGFSAPAQVDQRSLRFGRTGSEPSLAFCNASPEDVNGDRLGDLVCHFETHATGFQAGDTQGFLRGQTMTGVPIVGTDFVHIVR